VLQKSKYAYSIEIAVLSFM